MECRARIRVLAKKSTNIISNTMPKFCERLNISYAINAMGRHIRILDLQR
jgi:hypothetical protein